MRRLSPLGPGGRPFAGWRPLAALLGVGTLLAVAVVLLSDRAPGVLSWFSTRIDAGSSRAASVASEFRPRTAFQLHLLIWAVVTALVGLAMWSSTSVLAAAIAILALSLGAERAQDVLTQTRSMQISDAIANVFGVLAGLGFVSGVSTLFGWKDDAPRGSLDAPP
ncbi:MAG: hypothetical protein M3314_03540 [Actinomycetota bacterium]|nr:hypothetical protein [Actinomycetota bacterium]